MKRLSLAGLAAIVGLTMAAVPAGAQTVVDTDVGPSFGNVNGMIQPVGGASGDFHVVITRTGMAATSSTYSVTVTGNADGNAPGAPGAHTPDGAPIPKSGIGTISLNFFEAGVSGGTFNSTLAAGGTNAYSGAAGQNVGGPDNATFGTTGGAWDANPGGTTTFTTNLKPEYLAPHGGNVFTGTFTLGLGSGGGTSNIGTVQIALQDSGQQYSKQVQGQIPVVPEPGTLALLLPGLAPFGFLLRRRRPSGTEG